MARGRVTTNVMAAVVRAVVILHSTVSLCTCHAVAGTAVTSTASHASGVQSIDSRGAAVHVDAASQGVGSEFGIQGGGPRSVGWWWQPPSDNYTEAVEGLLRFVQSNRAIVSSVMMNCGLLTCCRTGCGECGNTRNASCKKDPDACTNNGGVGGTISGTMNPGCSAAIPELVAIGVRVELWLGNDPSLTSARWLFGHATQTASALTQIAAQHPGVSGFNFDLETHKGTRDDGVAFVKFLTTVSSALIGAPGGPLRVSADVACARPRDPVRNISGNCTLLAGGALIARGSGSRDIDVAAPNWRLLNMATYNARDYPSWVTLVKPTLQIPRGVLGAGLGCWIDSRTNNTWSITEESAQDRICYLMNKSITEIDMFVIKQDDPAHPDRNFPEPFWIPALNKFMKGGGCDSKLPPVVHCPTEMWRPGGEASGCCESNSNRGAGVPKCNASCAERECENAGMVWKPEDTKRHPYECCATIKQRG